MEQEAKIAQQLGGVLVQDDDEEIISIVRTLFREYANQLLLQGADISLFQAFEEELASLPGKYSSSNNSLLVVMVTVPFEEGQEEQPLRVIASSLRELPDGFDIIGCGALRELATDSSVTELKRLYIKPAYRRQGLARKLSIFLIDEARARGYESVFLDTLERLAGALELYRQLDFEEIEAYYHNPMEDVVYMKLDL